MPTPLQVLAANGQSPWIDYIARAFVRDGELDALIRDGIVGITSNPTIFQSAIAEGDAYDDQLRCLWASTSTKNPEYRDVLYVEELIGPQTVNTMPPATIEAFQDHGRVEPTLERDVDGARRTLQELAQAGIDYDDVVTTLEREGVEKFADSFKQLIDGVAAKRDQLVAA
jgi:transaldolase